MADTIGTKEAHEKWGYSQQTIAKWCREGLVKGATHDAVGSPWHIPANAECPKPVKKKGGGENEQDIQ